MLDFLIRLFFSGASSKTKKYVDEKVLNVRNGFYIYGIGRYSSY
jgi:hypothetical protein